MRLRALASLVLAFGFSGALAGASPLHAAEPGKARIVIDGMQFNPPELHVKLGERVTWENQDIVPHTATAEGHAFDSKAILLKKSWSWKARRKGSYPYSCTFHPTMKGLLVVE